MRSTDWPVNIQSADGTANETISDIVRDAFGKPTAIVRHNVANTVTETRSKVGWVERSDTHLHSTSRLPSLPRFRP